MDALLLARLQFGVVTVYHFFFVPVTLGLSVLIAIMETIYVKTGDEHWKKAVKFWGKLFLINFAIGVATGIVQEFQFGMNWSEYSRFMGDIFGAPLAIEALLAFYIESVFIGVWIFGWDKLSPKAHCAVAWMVAIGSNLSAVWILIANSFMQQPVGYVLRNGRAEMVDFFALASNGHVWVQWPHVFASAVATAGFALLCATGGPHTLSVLIAATVVMSLGMAPVFTVGNDIIVSSAPAERAGAAAALSETSAEFSGALGIALFGSLGTLIYRHGLEARLPGSIATGTLGDTLEQAAAAGPAGEALATAARAAFTDALQFTALCGALLVGVACVVVVRLLRTRD